MTPLLYLFLLLAPQAAPPTVDASGVRSRVTEAAARKSAGPQLSREQQELFLKTAKIVSKKDLDSGTTKSQRATLSDGRLTHDAHLQFIDVYQPLWKGKEGTVEKHFRDSYKFNVAAYRVDKLLDLGMVPVSVERDVDGRFGSVTWWIDDVWMTEAERRDKQVRPPAAQFWVDQLNKVKVFDQLIYNVDRNQGNLVITREWTLWLIDHTRSFRTHRTLLKPEALVRCDHNLLNKMRALNEATLTRELGPYLRREEITAILARRDLIVKFFEREVASKGEDSVLSGIPRKTPEASIP